MTELHFVVPPNLDDPLHPSGGNIYDRELANALTSLGHQVREHAVAAAWPDPAGDDLTQVLAGVPDKATVLIDSLVGLDAAAPLLREQERLQLWHLVHLPLALSVDDAHGVRPREHRALTAVAGVITTSGWTRRWLLETYGLNPGRVRVARPGASRAELCSGSTEGNAVVCVAAVTPAKGQDVLIAALAELADLHWTCRLVGPLGRAPTFVARLQEQIGAAGLTDRIQLTGPLARSDVGRALDSSDLLVLPTLLETFGMVVAEALARGVPVVASDTGGVAEALGCTTHAGRPGVLVPPDDVGALRDALRQWLSDASHRNRLRTAARARRALLDNWSTTAQSVLGAIHERC